jgi:uncharacterized membrane protein YhaH (DUF805 family)
MQFIGFLFSPAGRFRRMDYWLYVLLTTGLWFVFFFIAGLKMQGLGEAMRQMKADPTQPLPPGFTSFMFIFLGFSLVMLYSSFTCLIKRFHDLGNSGWNSLWFFVPFANIWFMIKVMFFRGEEGENKYGLSPYR